jgi:hypothetical protein
MVERTSTYLRKRNSTFIGSPSVVDSQTLVFRVWRDKASILVMEVDHRGLATRTVNG